MRRLSCRAFGRLPESGFFFLFFLSKKKIYIYILMTSQHHINVTRVRMYFTWRSLDACTFLRESMVYNFYVTIWVNPCWVRKVFLILWGVVHTVNTMISWLYQMVAYKRLKKQKNKKNKSVARNITACELLFTSGSVNLPN